MSIANEDKTGPVRQVPVRQRNGSMPPARRAAQTHVDTVECPRCGRFTAKIIGRSETVPVVYLRCEGCRQTSVAGA